MDAREFLFTVAMPPHYNATQPKSRPIFFSPLVDVHPRLSRQNSHAWTFSLSLTKPLFVSRCLFARQTCFCRSFAYRRPLCCYSPFADHLAFGCCCSH